MNWLLEMCADRIESDAFETLERVQRCSSAAEVYDAFGQFLCQFGFDGFLITEMPPAGFDLAPHVMLNGWSQQWYDQYMAAQHYNHDPMAKHTRQSTSPFLWSEVAQSQTLSPRARRVMDEAAQIGLNDGFSVPLHGALGQLSCVTMGGEKLEFPPRAREAIYLISIYAHEKAKLHREESGARKGPGGERRLTQREKEILIWVAEGKTDSEIGEICGISHETAYAHVRSCTNKFQASNRTQAVVRALLSGEIKLF